MFGLLTRSLATLTAVLGAGMPVALAVTLPVSTPAGLQNAIGIANPGDEIVLANGTYAITGNLSINRAGTMAQPIVLRAATPHAALIRFDAVEGFKVSVSDWRFEGLVIEGVCALDDDCEHAFHLLSGADRTVLRDNWVRDFNAQVKGNGEPLGAGGAYIFADDVLIEGNRFYDTRPRDTGNPVTKLDIVGGRRWIVRGNFIYDYEKLGGDTISYAAFLKGNSRDGVFERNWVMCSRNFSGGVRLGLSLGGGGTGAQFCEDGTCVTEHQNGRLRNNLIANCDDVGIYLNRAQNTLIDHNTLYNTSGIDVRFATSTATLRNNAITGAIRNRDGGTSTQSGNLVSVPLATMQGWFVNPAQGDFRALAVSTLVNQGVAGTGVVDDWCADDRDDGVNDIGALEYDGENDCDTRLDAPSGVVFANSFE
jgi:parallel beta-helix repeat protein